MAQLPTASRPIPTRRQRTATITVAGQSFGITQAAVVCSTTISPTASSPTAAGGGGDGGGDGERGVVRVDRGEQRAVDHHYGRCERYRERQRVVQRGRQCADEQPHRHDDDCRAGDDGDAGRRAVHIHHLADGVVAGAGGLDEHDCGDRAGGLRVDRQ